MTAIFNELFSTEKISKKIQEQFLQQQHTNA